jgi:histidinol-phosphate phosphatase family protein
VRRAAAFLDRDGTLIEEAHYLADPARVTLLPGAADALRELRAAGYLLVVVTNQSGIARGLFTEEDFRAVQERLESLLRAHGVTFDAVYHCPHHPDFTGPCDCRKPALGLYRRAESELGVDLAASIHVGDRLRDVLPALDTGGKGFLVRTGYGADAVDVPPEIDVAADLGAVAGSVTGR